MARAGASVIAWAVECDPHHRPRNFFPAAGAAQEKTLAAKKKPLNLDIPVGSGGGGVKSEKPLSIDDSTQETG